LFYFASTVFQKKLNFNKHDKAYQQDIGFPCYRKCCCIGITVSTLIWLELQYVALLSRANIIWYCSASVSNIRDPKTFVLLTCISGPTFLQFAHDLSLLMSLADIYARLNLFIYSYRDALSAFNGFIACCSTL